jgi:hypothetical protein
VHRIVVAPWRFRSLSEGTRRKRDADDSSGVGRR